MCVGGDSRGVGGVEQVEVKPASVYATGRRRRRRVG